MSACYWAPSAAAVSAQDAIKVDARNPLARFERAAVLEDQGRLQEALNELVVLKARRHTAHCSCRSWLCMRFVQSSQGATVERHL